MIRHKRQQAKQRRQVQRSVSIQPKTIVIVVRDSSTWKLSADGKKYGPIDI